MRNMRFVVAGVIAGLAVQASGANAWSCFEDLPVPVDAVPSIGSVACGSFDGKNCAWQDNIEKCRELVGSGAKLQSVVCGADHMAKYGNDGWGGPWCTLALRHLAASGAFANGGGATTTVTVTVGGTGTATMTTAPTATGLPQVAPLGVRNLDFKPFEDALNGITAKRRGELDAYVPEANVSVLRQKLDSKDLTSRELTAYYIDRIKRFDNRLKSVIELNPNALTDAAKADAELSTRAIKSPLHGIPVLLKDNIGTTLPLHTTAGALALLGTNSTQSFAVDRLIKSGAIILGKASLSEWSYYMSSAAPSGFSAVRGQVVSAHGGMIDPLGSSTGSAVALTAGLAALTVGTETMGSIISPAQKASVVGMRPSTGLVSRNAVAPIAEPWDAVGVMAKTVADAAALLTGLAKEGDPSDHFYKELSALGAYGSDFSANLSATALNGKTCVFLNMISQLDMFNDTQLLAFYGPMQTITAAALSAAGCNVSVMRKAFDGQTHGTEFQSSLVMGAKYDLDDYLRSVSNRPYSGESNPYAPKQGQVTSLASLVAWNAAQPSVRVPYGQDLLSAAASSGATREQYDALVAKLRNNTRAFLSSVFSTVDLVFAYGDVLGVVAAAGYPAMTIPFGLDATGAPSGPILVGKQGKDAELLGYAYALEQAGQKYKLGRVKPGTG